MEWPRCLPCGIPAPHGSGPEEGFPVNRSVRTSSTRFAGVAPAAGVGIAARLMPLTVVVNSGVLGDAPAAALKSSKSCPKATGCIHSTIIGAVVAVGTAVAVGTLVTRAPTGRTETALRTIGAAYAPACSERRISARRIIPFPPHPAHPCASLPGVRSLRTAQHHAWSHFPL